MLLNREGANIQYPYHNLPMKSTEDRIGFWALWGIYEEINGLTEGDEKNRIEIECAGKREDEK